MLAALFLLSTGEGDDLTDVAPMVKRIAANPAGPAASHWPKGYQGILMAEYYLRTGDDSVLPGIKKFCDNAAPGQYCGGWAHGGLAVEQSMGYVQSGLMNPNGATILTALVLAQECGVEVDEKMFASALRLFYRFVGHGAVPYGDHRPEMWMSCNGKNGMLAPAFYMLPKDLYHQAGRHLALDMADSYRWVRAGHTGGGFDVTWRAITAHMVPENRQEHYRSCMDRLAWYYDLSRQPGGGFSCVGEEGYAGEWSIGMAMAYTAPLRKLRITGMPPTRLSNKVKMPRRPWGNRKDDIFHSTDFCEGYGADDLEIHEIFDAIAKGDQAVCVRAMKHYSAVIRSEAAKKLAELQAVDELVACTQHSDVRVRNAACMGISNDNGFFRGLEGRGKGFLSPETVSEAFVPYFVKTLKSKRTSLAERDGILYAFSKAKPEDVRANLKLITPYLKHEDWYLRESAMYAMMGLRGAIQPKELFMMAETAAQEAHSKPQMSYAGIFGHLFQREKIVLSPASMEKFASIIGKQIVTPTVPRGMGAPARAQASFKSGMILKKAGMGAHKHLPMEYALMLKNWQVGQHAVWMITGSKWTDPLDQILAATGRDGKVLCQAIKATLQGIEGGTVSLGKKPDKNVAAVLKRGIDAFEREYGKVDAAYPEYKDTVKE